MTSTWCYKISRHRYLACTRQRVGGHRKLESVNISEIVVYRFPIFRSCYKISSIFNIVGWLFAQSHELLLIISKITVPIPSNRDQVSLVVRTWCENNFIVRAFLSRRSKTTKEAEDSLPDIEPSLGCKWWLLFIRDALLLFSLPGTPPGPEQSFPPSRTSWSCRQKRPSCLKANSSPGTSCLMQAEHRKHFIW